MVEVDYVITLIGNDTVGKTSIVNRLKYGTYQPHYLYTQGADKVRIPHFKVENDDVSLLIYDTGGHTIQRKIIGRFIAEADAIVVVYDVTNKKTFDNVPKWIKMAKKHKSYDANENPSNEDDSVSVKENDYVLMIFGNKTDLASRTVPEQKMEELARSKGISLHEEVSAKLNTNIDLAFKELVATLIQKRRPLRREQTQSKRSFCTIL